MLELKNITYVKDNKVILNNINIKVQDNEFVAITGPNGSGKSTLMKIIIGIIKPTSGSVIFNGEDISRLGIYERANKGIGFAFQQPVTFKGLKVKDLISLSAKTQDESIIYTCLSRVGLCPLDYKERQIDKTLSGGELKRIELASVLARNANLLLFDEPEAGIDLWSFSKLIQLFEHMKDKSIIIVSHQDKILKSATRVIVLKKGEIQEGEDYQSVSCDKCEFKVGEVD